MRRGGGVVGNGYRSTRDACREENITALLICVLLGDYHRGQVVYWRYLRFWDNGMVASLCTPEHPHKVARLFGTDAAAAANVGGRCVPTRAGWP